MKSWIKIILKLVIALALFFVFVILLYPATMHADPGGCFHLFPIINLKISCSMPLEGILVIYFLISVLIVFSISKLIWRKK